MSEREQLLAIFGAALAAVHGGDSVERALRERDPAGDCISLLAAGKAACAMAAGARAVLGERVREGLAVTKSGHGFPVPGVEVREASHPLPDARGVAAAGAALAWARRGPASRTLLVLLSGGASALWVAPAQGVSLEDKRIVTDGLLRAGVPIGALNAVRKHLSRIKGGGLARAARAARVVSLLISDVPGDAVDAIGSGPTAPDPTTYADALDVIAGAVGLDAVPRAVRHHLEAGAAGERAETPKPGDPLFERCECALVATLDHALEAASRAGAALGLRVVEAGAVLQGEARDWGPRLAERARALRGDLPALLVAGGEPVVHVRGEGRGGRAQELALAFALAAEGEGGLSALFAGTDGSDGPTDAAGGIVDGTTAARARERGLDPRAHLDRNDSHPVLAATGDLLVTGPTHTNVTDLALIRVAPGR